MVSLHLISYRYMHVHTHALTHARTHTHLLFDPCNTTNTTTLTTLHPPSKILSHDNYSKVFNFCCPRLLRHLVHHAHVHCSQLHFAGDEHEPLHSVLQSIQSLYSLYSCMHQAGSQLHNMHQAGSTCMQSASFMSQAGSPLGIYSMHQEIHQSAACIKLGQPFAAWI